MPSRRRQMCATAATVPGASANPDRTADARSTNRRTASLPSTSSIAAVVSRLGRPSGGTTNTASPAMLSASRLVVSSRSSGASCSTASARRAHATTRCSQLSRSSNRRRSRSQASSVSSIDRPPTARIPSVVAIAWGTRVSSWSDARFTSHTPSGNAPASSAARRSARRVLPVPPVPVSVTSRLAPSSLRTASSSPSRPTNEVRSSGRCPDGRPPAGPAPGRGDQRRTASAGRCPRAQATNAGC